MGDSIKGSKSKPKATAKQCKIEVWERLACTFYRMWSQIEKDVEKGPHTLPMHWFDILLVLSRSPEQRLRPSELAKKVVTSRAALSRSLDKMEKGGLIVQKKCNEDGRGQHSILTAKGLTALKETMPLYKSAVGDHFANDMTEADAVLFMKLLKKLT